MIKTRLYESEDDEVIKLIDKSNYDAILLENRPIDIIGEKPYRAILTRRKEASKFEDADKWILKIFMKTKVGMWQLTPGQWYLSTLLGEDQYGYEDYREEDVIEIEGKWRVAGMSDVVQEAVAKVNEFELKENEEPASFNIHSENKNIDYSKMKKTEIEKIVNQAIENKDYELLTKISKYLPESEIAVWEDTINEAIKHLKERSKAEILQNMKNDKFIRRKKKRRPLRTFESLNEVISTDGPLMGHNSSNPDDPEVNGLKNRIESEEDVENLEESVNEGCGCGGTKRPRPKMTPTPKRPKLHESNDDDFLMTSLIK